MSVQRQEHQARVEEDGGEIPTYFRKGNKEGSALKCPEAQQCSEPVRLEIKKGEYSRPGVSKALVVSVENRCQDFNDQVMKKIILSTFERKRNHKPEF